MEGDWNPAGGREIKQDVGIEVQVQKRGGLESQEESGNEGGEIGNFKSYSDTVTYCEG